MTRATRRLAVVAVMALLGGGAYWYWGSPQADQQVQQGQQAKQQQKGRPGFRRGGNLSDSVPVVATLAKFANVPVYFDGVGTAKALNTVTVRPQVDGKLITIMFTEGQEVPKGFVIA